MSKMENRDEELEIISLLKTFEKLGIIHDDMENCIFNHGAINEEINKEGKSKINEFFNTLSIEERSEIISNSLTHVLEDADVSVPTSTYAVGILLQDLLTQHIADYYYDKDILKMSSKEIKALLDEWNVEITPVISKIIKIITEKSLTNDVLVKLSLALIIKAMDIVNMDLTNKDNNIPAFKKNKKEDEINEMIKKKEAEIAELKNKLKGDK